MQGYTTQQGYMITSPRAMIVVESEACWAMSELFQKGVLTNCQKWEGYIFIFSFTSLYLIYISMYIERDLWKKIQNPTPACGGYATKAWILASPDLAYLLTERGLEVAIYECPGTGFCIEKQLGGLIYSPINKSSDRPPVSMCWWTVPFSAITGLWMWEN